MNKLKGKLVAGLTMVAFFGVLGSAHAQFQAPVAAPAVPTMETPAPPTMPAPPPMVAPEAPIPSTAPAVAPKALGPDDMSGQWGFGVGVGAQTATTSLVSISPNNSLYVRYWFNDSLSIVPMLRLKMYKVKGVDANWALDPNVVFLYCPWKTTSTRLTIGGGLGLAFQKWAGSSVEAAPTTTTGAPLPPPNDMTIGITLPLFAGVEHFFTKWFSMGIGVNDNLLTYSKTGDAWGMSLSLDNTTSITAVGFLFFYTD